MYHDVTKVYPYKGGVVSEADIMGPLASRSLISVVVDNIGGYIEFDTLITSASSIPVGRRGVTGSQFC